MRGLQAAEFYQTVNLTMKSLRLLRTITSKRSRAEHARLFLGGRRNLWLKPESSDRPFSGERDRTLGRVDLKSVQKGA